MARVPIFPSTKKLDSKQPFLEVFNRHALLYPEVDQQMMMTHIMMRKLSSRVDHAYEISMAKDGMSVQRFLAMVHLMSAPKYSLTPADLAMQCGVTRATMTGVVDTLEKAGFVERISNPDDRRSLTIKLLPAGRKKMEAFLPRHCRRVERMMNVLTRAEMKQLAHLMEKLWPAVGAMVDD